jgi:hypothetical protein
VFTALKRIITIFYSYDKTIANYTIFWTFIDVMREIIFTYNWVMRSEL